MPETPTATPYDQSGVLVAATDDENVTTTIRVDIKKLGSSIQSLQREVATLRWMIGIGFTLLSIFVALSTFLRA